MFHEGHDPNAARAFQEIARLTGGAYARFDARAGGPARTAARRGRLCGKWRRRSYKAGSGQRTGARPADLDDRAPAMTLLYGIAAAAILGLFLHNFRNANTAALAKIIRVGGGI